MSQEFPGMKNGSAVFEVPRVNLAHGGVPS